MLPSRKLHPFKLLVLLIYGTYSNVQWREGSVKMKIGPMARLIGVPNSRLKEYLSDLARMGYLQDLDLGYGVATFTIRLPPRGRLQEVAA